MNLTVNLTNIRKAYVNSLESSRLLFLAKWLFQFKYYDDSQGELFTRKALEVCKALSDGSVSEYIKVEHQRQWYYTMMNFDWFRCGNVKGDRWGGFICKHLRYFSDVVPEAPEVFEGSRKDWNKFIRSLIRFAK